MQDRNLKIIVAGDGGVGKTTLLLKYVSGTFIVDTSLTIGVQFHQKNILFDGLTYSLYLWDLGGQDRFRFMLPSYVLGAKGALLLYDTTRVDTLNGLEEWARICRTHDTNIPILLLGTKIDRDEDRSVGPDLARSYLPALKLCNCFEVSAKTGANVGEAFQMLVQEILKTSTSKL